MPAMITNYQLLGSQATDLLVDQVNGMIAEGWQPLGGPTSFVCQDGQYILVQAMVRISDTVRTETKDAQP